MREKSLENLIKNLRRLPTIGPKTASRLAFHILKMPKDDVVSLSQAILSVKEKIKFCRECFNISEDELCRFCSDETRDRKIICVVEEPKDIFVIEETQKYSGIYHVLGGAISYLEDIGPEKIRIKELEERVKRNSVHEVIVATNPNMEGDATAIYISKLLKSHNVRVTRIAYGLPVGGDLEFADPVTMARSLEGRVVV
ncbi:TPA: recombination protein RecR [bacterium]|nr:recombination protein RecR [bacterium]